MWTKLDTVQMLSSLSRDFAISGKI